jgi:hypothetical protein
VVSVTFGGQLCEWDDRVFNGDNSVRAEVPVVMRICMSSVLKVRRSPEALLSKRATRRLKPQDSKQSVDRNCDPACGWRVRTLRVRFELRAQGLPGPSGCSVE